MEEPGSGRETAEASASPVGRFDSGASRWSARNILVLVIAAAVALLIIAGALVFILESIFTGRLS